jgi:hypothetical protein
MIHMKKVTCTRQNASDEINGIKFSVREDGAVVAVIEDDDAAQFADFPGYETEDAAESPKDASEKGKNKKAPAG